MEQPNAFDFVLTRPDAVPPAKALPSDAGFDLVAVAVVPFPTSNFGDVTGLVTLFDTGVAVRPPPGFYFDMVARSSLSKSGYMLANGVGVIDPAYRGSVKVPLIRVDPNAPPLVLPARIVQLVPRRVHDLEARQLRAWDAITERGDAGFGSSGIGAHAYGVHQ